MLLLFLVFTMVVVAQQPIYQWSKVFQSHNENNASVYSNGRSVAVDQAGNVYSAGLFNYTIDLDPGPALYPVTATGPYEYGIYISRLSPTGDFVWGFQLPLLVEFGNVEITIDKDGYIYVGSELRSAADFDPGPGAYILKPTGGWDAFVAKYSPDGKLVWAKQFGGPGDTAPRTDVLTTDKDNNVIVCGNFNNTVDFDPGPGTFNITSSAHIQSFVVKLNSKGEFIWAKQLGNSDIVYSGASIKDVTCDKDGNIYTVGDFAGDCDFDPGPGVFKLKATGTNEGYIAKLDAGGGLIWARQIGNTNDVDAFSTSRDIAIDKQNNVYTTGTILGTFDFDPGEKTHIVNGVNFDWYVLKLNAAGNFVWVDMFASEGTDEGTDVAVDSTGAMYVTGYIGHSTDMDPGPGVHMLTSQGEYGAAALVRLSPEGNLLFAGLADGVGNILFRRMALDNTSNIYMTGYITAGVVDFDFGPGLGVSSCDNDEAPYVVKYGPCKNVTTAELNVSTCDSYTLNNEVFDSSGTYIRRLQNSTGCDSVVTLHLVITKKYSEKKIVICEGDTVFAGGKMQTTTGVYRDTLKTVLNCDSVITTYLTVNPKPQPNLGPDKAICAGTSITLSPGTFDKYLWQNSITSDKLTVDSAGVYSVNVTNSFGCSAADTMVITAVLPLPANFLPLTDSICTYEQLKVTSSQSYDQYFWSTGSTQRFTMVDTPGVYWLQVTDGNGCIGKDTINVVAKICMIGVYVPTAFTPNSDGRNDYFGALVFGKVISFRLQVFNRFGEQVFESTNPGKGWDGMNKGQVSPTSVYVWQCSYQLAGQKAGFQRGTVTLIR